MSTRGENTDSQQSLLFFLKSLKQLNLCTRNPQISITMQKGNLTCIQSSLKFTFMGVFYNILNTQIGIVTLF